VVKVGGEWGGFVQRGGVGYFRTLKKPKAERRKLCPFRLREVCGQGVAQKRKASPRPEARKSSSEPTVATVVAQRVAFLHREKAVCRGKGVGG